jgi:hypothetical protein
MDYFKIGLILDPFVLTYYFVDILECFDRTINRQSNSLSTMYEYFKKNP